MTNEAINRTCAELCGWKLIASHDEFIAGMTQAVPDCWVSPDGESYYLSNVAGTPLPPFTTSLDAAQMAFKALTKEQQWWAAFHLARFGICDIMLATPLQWCEAILRATGKWEE